MAGDVWVPTGRGVVRPRRWWGWVCLLVGAGAVAGAVALAVSLPSQAAERRDFAAAEPCPGNVRAADCRWSVLAMIVDTKHVRGRSASYSLKFRGDHVPSGWVETSRNAYEALDEGELVHVDIWHGKVVGVSQGNRHWWAGDDPAERYTWMVAGLLALLPLGGSVLVVGVARVRGRPLGGVADRRRIPVRSHHVAAVAFPLGFTTMLASGVVTGMEWPTAALSAMWVASAAVAAVVVVRRGNAFLTPPRSADATGSFGLSWWQKPFGPRGVTPGAAGKAGRNAAAFARGEEVVVKVRVHKSSQIRAWPEGEQYLTVSRDAVQRSGKPETPAADRRTVQVDRFTPQRLERVGDTSPWWRLLGVWRGDRKQVSLAIDAAPEDIRYVVAAFGAEELWPGDGSADRAAAASPEAAAPAGE